MYDIYIFIAKKAILSFNGREFQASGELTKNASCNESQGARVHKVKGQNHHPFTGNSSELNRT